MTNIFLLALALFISLWLRPWRMLMQSELLTPLLACLVLLPWVWALPNLHQMPLQLPDGRGRPQRGGGSAQRSSQSLQSIPLPYRGGQGLG